MSRFRPWSRRGRRLNAALHEVRRPAQLLAIMLERRLPEDGEAGACVAALRSALTGMDDAINDVRRPLRRVPLEAEELLSGLEARWRSAASVNCLAGAAIAPPALVGDPAALGRALDNLVANALEHGSSPVQVAVRRDENGVRFEVRDGGASGAGRDRPRGDPRRGHGLRLVAEIAEAHGGTAIPPRFERAGTTATLRLPAAAPRPLS